MQKHKHRTNGVILFRGGLGNQKQTFQLLLFCLAMVPTKFHNILRNIGFHISILCLVKRREPVFFGEEKEEESRARKS